MVYVDVQKEALKKSLEFLYGADECYPAGVS